MRPAVQQARAEVLLVGEDGEESHEPQVHVRILVADGLVRERREGGGGLIRGGKRGGGKRREREVLIRERREGGGVVKGKEREGRFTSGSS